MVKEHYVILLYILSILQGLDCMATSRKSNDCEKQIRNLNSRIKNVGKEFQYIANSFDCNIKYIFDGVYGQFYSSVDEINQMLENNSSRTIEMCKDLYKEDLLILNIEPYDDCYNNNNIILMQLKRVANIETEAESICRPCNSISECKVNIKKILDNLEEFKSTAPSTLKDVEKSVKNCVTKISERINLSFGNLLTNFKSCVYTAN
ncbi:hypothetical protein FQA39_LY13311 [Lamprigera yunnana]|nr:hypothetical protein FQA39_LY13311 [Lamprigera yunnana]